MNRFRVIHRTAALLVLLFTLHIGVTGALMQIVDLTAILGNAPATSPAMQAIRESIDGDAGFAVIAPSDYDRPPLPGTLDYPKAFATVLGGAAAQVAQAPVQFIELRGTPGGPIGQVASASQAWRVDPATGRLIDTTPVKHGWQPQPPSLHHSLKWIHRIFSDGYLWINCLIGIGVLVLVVTGMVVYVRMLVARRRQGRTALFWQSASRWRQLHRSIALVASVFLVYVAITGIWLSVDSFMMGRYRAAMAGRPPAPEAARPLDPAAIPAMLHVTLAAWQAGHHGQAIKVLRLRDYAGYPQGIVISGAETTGQFVFNAATGAPMSATAPGYPKTGFPLGWQIHETLKRLHRGDYFGLSGRLIDLLAGLSLAYLSLSGLVMHYGILRTRRRGT